VCVCVYVCMCLIVCDPDTSDRCYLDPTWCVQPQKGSGRYLRLSVIMELEYCHRFDHALYVGSIRNR
jgi:hypothetical protein